MENIVRIKFGSHLYGTDTPVSDLDYKSVHLPSSEEILLQRVANSVSSKRTKAEGEKNSPGDVDEESYSLQRYLHLLADGQTVALDMLFAPTSCLLCTTSLWQEIRANKDRFLSKRSAAFVGYCRQQANKYGIKGSRVAVAKQAADLFQRHYALLGPTAKVGDIHLGVFETLLGEHSRFVEQPINSVGDIGTFFECCNRKVSFDATVKHAAEIFTRIYENYGDRARKAQDNEGIDWKALSHAVRVGREALELLGDHQITFPLPYRERVLEIKQGRLDYQEVSEEIEQLLCEVEQASAVSTLPDEPDREYIDYLVRREYGRIVRF